MELSAFSDQPSAKPLFLRSFADSSMLARRPYGRLMTDGVIPKRLVYG
jgi:hypothetical protein